MATVNLSFVLSSGTYSSQQASPYGSADYPWHFPDTYVDSGSPLTLIDGGIPLTVTAGQKYYTWNYDNTNSGVMYIEVVTSGVRTNSSKLPSSNRDFLSYTNATFGRATSLLNQLQTDGTATLRVRRFSGWSRASPREDRHDPFHRPSYTGYDYAGYMVFVASTSNIGQTVWRSTQLDRGSSVISCSKTFPASTYVAGSKLLNKNIITSYPVHFGYVARIIKGMTIGDDPSVPVNTGSYYNQNVYAWSSSVFFDRCTFQANRVENGYGYDDSGAHGMTGDNILCTFKSNPTGASAPLLYRQDNVVNFGTFIRGGSGYLLPHLTDGYVAAYPTYQNNLTLFACDLTGLSGVSVNNAAVAMDASNCAFTSTSVTGTPLYPGTNYYNCTINGGSATSGANTTYYRIGGATDGFSSYSKALYISPSSYLTISLASFYNTKVNESFDVTFEFQWGNTAGSGISTLSNEDVWIEATYLSDPSSSATTTVFSHDLYNRPGLFTTKGAPTALPTSTASWAGALANAVKQKVSVRVHPRRVGQITFFVKARMCTYTRNQFSGTSILLCICPKPTLTNAS